MSPETRVMSPAIIRIFHMDIKFCALKFREDFYSLVLNFAIFLQWQKSEFKYQLGTFVQKIVAIETIGGQ